MTPGLRFRSRGIRLGLLAAAVLHIAGVAIVPVLHRHVLRSTETVWSPEQSPGSTPLHLQFCEACAAHGAAALPAAAVVQPSLPSAHIATIIEAVARTSSQRPAYSQARAPPIV